MTVCRKAVATNDRDGVAGPINLDQRHLLLVEPGQYVEADAAAAVQHDDARRKVSVAFEVAVGLLLLRIVGEAIPNEERARFDPKRNSVTGKDQWIMSRLPPHSFVFPTRPVISPMPGAV